MVNFKTVVTTWMDLSASLNGKHVAFCLGDTQYQHVYCSAIPPNYDLTYEFNITQNGSYWIHSHYMASTFLGHLYDIHYISNRLT